MFEAIETEQLACVHGGMDPNARWIMQHESGGNTHAKNPHSTAFGAFQMTIANRRHYMGKNYASTDLNAQYSAASGYVHDRYGSWSNAKRFWQNHHWY
ncbi:MAG TPA: transglycosylase SLT domain-containing protein [Kofleriaceae bacterium]|nr:transglycosylase SLT domain-containing protein [Kofleriaceae bacterium]